jgi:hypothetical protein
MRCVSLLFGALAWAAAASAAPVDWQGRTAAFFGVTFIDTSHEGELNGPRVDEAARVEQAEAQIAAGLEERGLELVDLGPVAEELARTANPSDCNGCEVRMARRLGADLAVVAEVQKVSNLILSMNVVVRAAATGEPVRALAVDIRGNTDESWRRGIGYILRNGIFID